MKHARENLLIAAGALGLFGSAYAAGRMLGSSARALQREPRDHGLPEASQARAPLPKASLLDTLAALLDVFAPNIAQGVILRRPRVLELAERLDLDKRAIKRMQKLHDKYGSGPLLLRLPVRNQAVLLDPRHVRRVLTGSPEPFATASSEKRAALSHFEPKGALVSHGRARVERRRFNEAVLDHERKVHRLAENMMPVVEQEAERIVAHAQARGELVWQDFAEGWFRMVRRVAFGQAAADDRELDAWMIALRSAGNWAFLHPGKPAVRQRLLARIRHYLDLAEPGTLAGMAAMLKKGPQSAPEHQVPQWLFAFDAAAMATLRALALLAVHPQYAARVREEVRTHTGQQRQHLPLLRAALLESLRLWATTPLILRQTTRETEWEHGVMPAGTGVTLFAPYFHRDDRHLPCADRYCPELWLEPGKQDDWPLVPFSDGPANCPGRHLVLMLGSAMLAALMERRQFRLIDAARLDPQRLPGALNHYSLRFAMS